jgi:hypothetical protein
MNGASGEPGQAARDLGLADAGGAHHDDVLGRDLVAQAFFGSCMRRQRLRRAMATARLAASWPMMWRSSFGDDLTGSHLIHAHGRSSSTVMCWLV